MLRNPVDESRYLGQHERGLRLTLASIHLGMAALVGAGVLLDLSKLSGADRMISMTSRGAMLLFLLGGLAWARGRPVEQLGAIMQASLVAAYAGYAVIASTFLRATGRADYVILLSGSAALLLPAQIAPARRAWPLFSICVVLPAAIGGFAGLTPGDVAWDTFTVGSCAALGLLMNHIWNSQARISFLANERAVRAEAELRLLQEADARTARRALERRDSEWDAILRAAPMALSIVDESGLVTFANDSARELGLVPNEDFPSALRGPGEGERGDPLASVFGAGQIAHFDHTFGREEEQRTFSFSAAAIGEAPYERAIVIGVDRTEAHRLAEQLHQAQKLQTIGSLAGSVAHDFNNLLTVISGAAELLAYEALSEEGRLLVGDLQMTSSRAAGLTRQLLLFSRRQPVRLRSLDLGVVVSRARPLMERILGPESSLRLELHERLPAISMDLSHVEQILMNLTVNARDAMPHGGELVVSVAEVPGGVELRVRDHGHGFAPETVERVFEPFFTTKGPGHGTGIGLATVKGIVDGAGGRVSAGNAAGGGALVTVFLPRAERSAGSGPEKIAEPHVGRRVLVVDDSEDVLRLAVRLLERRGFSVLRAQSLEEARAALDGAAALDALVSDVRLKGARGTAVAAVARERFPGLPVVYISGFVDDVEVLEQVERGEALLLDKPFTSRALLQALERALRTGAGDVDEPRPPAS